MSKKIISVFLTIALFVCLIPNTIFGLVVPEIYKSSVSVKVGETVNIGFTYGDSARSAEVVISNLKIDSYISGNNLYIKGVLAGSAYVTLNFNDGSSDDIKVEILDKSGSSTNVSSNEIEIIKDNYKNIYVDLKGYNTNKATIVYDSYYVSVNKSTFNTSENLRLTGKNRGDSVLKIKYDSGEVDTYYISVVSSSSVSSPDIDMLVGEEYTHYIDLEDVGASRATIIYDSSYIGLNKSNFTSSGNLKILGLKRGTTEIKLKYDTGYIVYLPIYIGYSNLGEKASTSVSELNIDKGSYDYFHVYLGDCSKATLSVNNSNVILSSSTIYSDTRIKVTGKNVGSTTLRITYDDGTRISIPIEVISKNYISPTASVTSTKIKLNSKTELCLFMGSVSGPITLTVENPAKLQLDLNNYSKYTKTYTLNSVKDSTFYIDIKGIELVNDTCIYVKFSDGSTSKIILSVVEILEDKTEGLTKKGSNFILKDNISINRNILNIGYISGYTDGSFGPLRTITREEFAVMLSRILNSNVTITSKDYILDVSSDWSKDSIAKLAALDIIQRTELFRPKSNITRNEVIEILYNVLNLSDFSSVCSLNDIGNNSLSEKISKCFNSGVIAGYPNGSFSGLNTISRAEAVVMLNRIFYSDTTTTKSNIFNDVSKDYWAYSYILKASKN